MKFDTRLLTADPAVESSQSKNCWLFVHAGTYAFYFWRFWRMDNSDSAFRFDYFCRGRVRARQERNKQ